MTNVKYQIFISSTYTDLIEERDGIIKAVLEMYHIPIGMEMFSAEDEDQWEIIRRTIDVSDYYVLILGLRYGSKTKEGIGFTQKEYEYALKKNIPILAFLMNETARVSQDQRDNDLTEINNFRKMVLENSKMSQFWASKDELIRNVSISLMKQIMQKPGIGWVRGDNSTSTKVLSQELASLSKENRSLRDQVRELESKLTTKKPKINVSIKQIFVGNNFHACERIAVPNKINFADIEPHLQEYITSEQLEKYNNEIPTSDEIERYNKNIDKYHKYKTQSSELYIEVSNLGRYKANNIYIDISFPDTLFISEQHDDEAFEKPRNPTPYNPVNSAISQYQKSSHNIRGRSILDGMAGPYALSGVTPFTGLKMANLRNFNQSSWTKLIESVVTVKIDSLLHTRQRIFDGEYNITPFSTGVHEVMVSVICEEYEEAENILIELNIQDQP